MTDIVLLSKDELAAIIDKRLDFAFTRHRRMFDSIGQGTNQTGLDTKVLNENLNDVFDELNKVKRELTSLKDYVKLLSKDIDALNFAVRKFTDKQPQDTMCQAYIK